MKVFRLLLQKEQKYKKGNLNMKVLYAAAEAVPFIKVGGLGDVMGGLPKELNKTGIDARVVIPFYSQIKDEYREKAEFIKTIGVPLGWRMCYCGIFKAEIDGVIYYLVDNEQYFKRENAPDGSPEYCIEGCPVADECCYNAVKMYCGNDEFDWFRRHVADNVDPSDEEVTEALRKTMYGKCVYKCNNNVVDHQTVNMEFEEGITVSFTMSAFTKGGRKIHIMGTKGEITASMNESSFEFFDFLTRQTRNIEADSVVTGDSIVGGHGGGDEGIVESLYDYLTGGISGEDISEIGISAQNHMLAFAAEKSRLEDIVVDVEEFCREYHI